MRDVDLRVRDFGDLGGHGGGDRWVGVAETGDALCVCVRVGSHRQTGGDEDGEEGMGRVWSVRGGM